ncbi:MAG TPA: DUF2306 domain-containing protein [Burkholderiaceae bacterium]|nr:DUF2306 domain-containing protein [Burkholderiaceae bacterium]
MTLTTTLASVPPVILVHAAFAFAALATGPVAFTARKGSTLHRLMGYVWISLMLATALSSFFIRDFRLPNTAGYTPIHLLSVAALLGLGFGVWFIVQRRILAHRRVMRATYVSLVVAGLLTLAPKRLFGGMLVQALGLA